MDRSLNEKSLTRLLDESSNLSISQIKRLLNKMNSAELAHCLESSPPKQRKLLWSLIDYEDEGDVLADLGDEIQQELLLEISNEELSEVVVDLELDEIVDILQIPAFLVRQTDLLVAAAKTNKYINLKKGQFMSPNSMFHAVKKITDSGNKNIMITERGSMFGYQDLLVDFRGIPIMKKFAPVVLDVTHSLQQPNQTSGVTGGKPEMIETIAKAGIASGVNGIFVETHFDPKKAKSDGANMLNINKLEAILKKLIAINTAVNSFK